MTFLERDVHDFARKKRHESNGEIQFEKLIMSVSVTRLEC